MMVDERFQEMGRREISKEKRGLKQIFDGHNLSPLQ